VEHFAFDPATMECEAFVYDCEASERNENDFATLEACNAACATYELTTRGIQAFTSAGDPASCVAPPTTTACDDTAPSYYFDPRIRECLPLECLEGRNRFETFRDCEVACLIDDERTLAGDDALAILGRSSCEGLGEQVTDSTSGPTFTQDGSVLTRAETWGCGCATRAEWVMIYHLPESSSGPLELRLCHDDFGDICEAGCNAELSWDLSDAFKRSGTTDFVFVD
jgi:hypothetical protein